MKKISGIFLVSIAAISLSACSWELPTCYDELDECGRDGAYTEERTAKAGKKKVMVKPRPEPVVMAQPEPAPAPAAPEPPAAPAPEPIVVDDTPVMRSAEPHFQHISK